MDPSDGQDLPRRPWHEGPEDSRSTDSWLRLNDDELLHRIETVSSQHDTDERLLEVVASDRHFFIRQEAAKRIRRKKLLFPYEDDRHIGQILVRHLNRREDVTYLERLVMRCTHGEVRKAAQVQLARLRRRLTDHDRREAVRPGAAPWRIAVIHSDAALRQTIAETLRPPEYEVIGHESGADAVAAVKGFDPHLVLAGVDDLLGAGLHAAIRNREKPLPVIVLCNVESAGRFSEVVGKIADDFILLPLQEGLVAAKVRALLHLAHVAPRRAERRKVSGPIGEDGVLPLLKLCEEEQLTCRLVVVAPGVRYFADFVDGQMMEAGGVPPLPDDEALAAILAVRTGTYEIIEASPIAPRDDEEETIEVSPQGVVSSPPASAERPLDAASGWRAPNDVDTTLLGWAVHFIVEQAWAHLGTAATAGLLRRTLQQGLERHPLLRVFIVQENAHVGIDLTQGARLPGEVVGITAQWMAVFLAAARRIAPDAKSIDVREATKIVGAALEQVDFYAAFERAASQKEPQAPSQVIGRINVTRRKA
jgi:DNA-binding NarL/FixJ family response regulator